jgi:hypothetical protein
MSKNLQISNCKLQIATCKLQIATCKLQIATCKFFHRMIHQGNEVLAIFLRMTFSNI